MTYRAEYHGASWCGKTRRHHTAQDAWDALVRTGRRRGVDLGHMPGVVAGDLREPGSIQGARGNGTAFIIQEAN